MTDTSEIARTYYDIIGRGAAAFDPERLRAILAPDLAFEGPIAGAVRGAERFLGGVAGFARTATGTTVLHRLTDGAEVATLYDAELPGGRVRFAEFLEFRDGRIGSVRLLYDAADYVAKGGR